MASQKRPPNKLLGIELRSLEPKKNVLLPRLGLFVPGSGDMSAALRVEIGKYNPVKYLKLVSGLMSLRESRPEEFNREIEREGRDPREILRGYQIRHLIRELLQSNAPWDSGPAPHSRDIVMHCEWAQNSLCQADRGVLAQIHRRDDYAAAERAIGARKGDGPGTIWGRGRPVSVFSCRGETL